MGAYSRAPAWRDPTDRHDSSEGDGPSALGGVRGWCAMAVESSCSDMEDDDEDRLMRPVRAPPAASLWAAAGAAGSVGQALSPTAAAMPTGAPAVGTVGTAHLRGAAAGTVAGRSAGAAPPDRWSLVAGGCGLAASATISVISARTPNVAKCFLYRRTAAGTDNTATVSDQENPATAWGGRNDNVPILDLFVSEAHVIVGQVV